MPKGSLLGRYDRVQRLGVISNLDPFHKARECVDLSQLDPHHTISLA